MPRFPRIYSEAPIPSGLSSREMPLDDPAAAALAQSGQIVAQTGLTLYDQQAKIAAQLRKADAGLELDQAMSQLKVQFAEREAALKDQGLHPDAYAPAVTRELKDLGTSLSGTMRYPEAQAAFQQKFSQFQGEQGVKAVHESWKLKYAMIETGWGIQQREDATAAVFGATAQERQDAFARGLARPDQGMRRGFYTGEQAAAKVTAFLADVEKAGAMRDFRNPDLQVRVIDGLLAGAYKHMTPTEQIGLAHTLSEQRDATERANETAVEKGWKAHQETEVASLWRQAELKTKADGTPLTREDIHAASERLGLNRIEINALTSELAKAPDEKPSDRATFDRVSADVESYSPKTSEQEIKRLHAADLLNTKDRNDLLSKRTSRITHLVEHGESQMGRQQAQAQLRIRTELNIPDIMPPGFDDKLLRAYAGAIRDLEVTSAYFPRGPGEPPGLRKPPLDVVPDIIAKWKPVASGGEVLAIQKAAAMATYKSMAELDTAFPTRSGPQYRAERDRTVEYLNALKAKAEADQKRAETGGKKPTKPGTFSPGTALPEVK